MSARATPLIRRFFPFILLIAIGVVFIALGGRKYLNYEEIFSLQDQMIAFVNAHPALTVLLFSSIYAIVTISLVPGLTLLDLVAGLLFVQPVAFILVLLSATLGATLLFLASRYAFSDLLREKGGKWVDKIQAGFDRHQEGYLIFLRLIPVFPFGAISIALGFIRISLFKYVWTTLVGTIPTAFVLTLAGKHIHDFAKGEFSAYLAYLPQIILIYSVFGLSLLLLKWIRQKKKVVTKESENNEE